MPRPSASRLVCAGCGHRVPLGERRPFRCPKRLPGDEVDHVLRRRLQPGRIGPPEEMRRLFAAPEANPFLRYRRLLHSYEVGRSRGLEDAGFVGLVERLDAAVARVDGHGFRETPLVPAPALAREAGVAGMLVKDETGNVSGTHKARHVAGLLLWLQVTERLGWAEKEDRPLAMASCGNAALAAAVLSKAVGRRLDLFVPPDAHPGVLRRLTALGGRLTPCPRKDAEKGDPCYRRLQEALREGAVPFTVQGPDNGLAIEGGATLAWEMVSALGRGGESIDRLFVQVGGGALAAAVIQGLREARELGVLDALPRIHAVQTLASPLLRAWERVVARLLEGGASAADDEAARTRARQAEQLGDLSEQRVSEVLAYAARHRGEFMWPWETEPESIADAILDDETYDWLAVTEGMLATGGWPLAVSEERLVEAHELARRETAIPVSPTGSAGLAGCLDLARAGLLRPNERVAVLFTGVERAGN